MGDPEPDYLNHSMTTISSSQKVEASIFIRLKLEMWTQIDSRNGLMPTQSWLITFVSKFQMVYWGDMEGPKDSFYIVV